MALIDWAHWTSVERQYVALGISSGLPTSCLSPPSTHHHELAHGTYDPRTFIGPPPPYHTLTWWWSCHVQNLPEVLRRNTASLNCVPALALPRSEGFLALRRIMNCIRWDEWCSLCVVLLTAGAISFRAI